MQGSDKLEASFLPAACSLHVQTAPTSAIPLLTLNPPPPPNTKYSRYIMSYHNEEYAVLGGLGGLLLVGAEYLKICRQV